MTGICKAFARLFFLFLLTSLPAKAQCFQIESILVDACDAGDEGLNEMVRLKVGPAAINTAGMTVTWPNNTWQGLVQNATTAAKVAQLNADILAAGGCGELIQPVGGVLPANATVILVTSFNMDTALNQFGAITEDIYILFQNNPSNITGHFANFGTGNRTLSITLGGCSDVVTYNRALLVDADGVPGSANGATVNFTPAGVASYTNSGCMAPVPPFTVDAGSPQSACAGSSVSLSGAATGYVSVAWSAPSGTFSDAMSLTSTYTLDAAAATPITLTLTVTNICGASISDTVVITPTPAVTPTFNLTTTYCTGATVQSLPTTSQNGIIGTWSPATISNTASGSYVFTPNAGQCALPFTLDVTVASSITPTFNLTTAYCQGSTGQTLPTTSQNGITGSWSPSTISNTTSGSYVFTPNAGQCASPFTLNVTITNSITPTFNLTTTYCQGSTVQTLPTTSQNGITGSWSPATISNTTNGSYVFTPDAGQCASPFTLNVTITNSILPTFNLTTTYCQGSTVQTLPTTSQNGITGSWSPATISNTASGSYVFTPDAGQCASPFTLNVMVTNSITPTFNLITTYCQGSAVQTLPTTSQNGITGTWSPATISNTVSGSYVFTPNAGQCASPFTLNVTIANSITPTFNLTTAYCQGVTVQTLPTTSQNGITGSWSPATISNTTNGSYVFTPDAGQCASPFTLNVTITNSILPTFNLTTTYCQGSTVQTLPTTSQNGISGTWSPSTISNTANGSYVFTPNAGQCSSSYTLNVTITNAITPTFNLTTTYCQGASVQTLPTISQNGITGSWSPATISNIASGSYAFTPDAGQCASQFTLNVTVTNSITPTFNLLTTYCQGSTVETLPMTSQNGITGSWSPSTISNTASGSYVFTPHAGQCASLFTLNVTITNSITPTFNLTTTYCQGSTVQTLPTTSQNGITGSWSPSTISNTASGSYVFTPDAGQCASPFALNVTITNSITPTFNLTTTYCQGSTVQSLPTTSQNGVTGTWSPAIVSNQTSGTYVFTPMAGQCAANYVLQVTVNPLPQADIRDGFLCVDNAGAVLNAYTLNTGIPSSGYTFSWTLDGSPIGSNAPIHIATVPGTYSVTVTNTVTGCSVSDQATVSVASGMTVTAHTPGDFQNDNTAYISVSGGSGQYEYILDGQITQYFGTFSGLQPGHHVVEVRDLAGCGQETVEFFFLNYPVYFTPNGDGFHDWWNISGLSDQYAVIHIFDRYGKLLKTLRAADDHGWDGTYNGHAMPSTDYWFTLDYTDRLGGKKQFRAHFALKR